MDTSTVTLFLALLAVGCQLFVVATLVLVVGGVLSRPVASARDRLRAELDGPGLWLAFTIAAVATAGSLYLSEIAHFEPCRLCWIQRGFMYPLVPVLGIAAWRGFTRIRWFAVPWALGGACVSTWHVLIERFPDLEGSTSCDPTNPCSLKWVEELGYLTIPTMALSGFLAIVAVLALLPSRPARTPDLPSPATELEHTAP